METNVNTFARECYEWAYITYSRISGIPYIRIAVCRVEQVSKIVVISAKRMCVFRCSAAFTSYRKLQNTYFVHDRASKIIIKLVGNDWL